MANIEIFLGEYYYSLVSSKSFTRKLPEANETFKFPAKDKKALKTLFDNNPYQSF